MAQKPWGGVFQQPTDQRVEAFSESISFDRRLYAHDLACNRAHARMLAGVGLLTPEELAQLEGGLDEIGHEIERGDFAFRTELEDIHMHIERALVDRLGDVGRKLHTARSRNDQVTTDLRLWIRAAVDELDQLLVLVQRAFVERCPADRAVILPGYTHMQRAQPVLAPHYWLAYCEKFERDRVRLAAVRRSAGMLTLGTAALAGTTLPIDREQVRRELGFESLAANSLDASSDRDFALEFAFACSVIAAHLSTWAEEWILWSTTEFGFLKLPQAFCTGSSIMPQKVNPDVLELTRGRTARVIGNLQTLLVLVKGLPLAYNRDLQEDKEPLFDSFDTVRACLGVAAPLVAGAELDRETIAAGLARGHLDATTLMEHMIRLGVPQRTAHHLCGNLVRTAMDRGVTLAELPLEVFQQAHAALDQRVYDVLGPQRAVAAFASYGSTAPAEVDRQIAVWQQRLGIAQSEGTVTEDKSNMLAIHSGHSSDAQFLSSPLKEDGSGVKGSAKKAKQGRTRAQKNLNLLFALSMLLVTPNVALAQVDPIAAAAAEAAAAADDPIAALDAEAAALANDPDVVALLETNPTTPSQLVRAINILIDLNKTPAARPLLKQLVDANLSEDQLAALAGEFGAAVMLRLARLPELQPLGAEFSRQVVNAAETVARDPQRLAAAIKDLTDADESKRRTAFGVLRAGGAPAAAMLIAALADPARAEEHAAIRTALVGIGEAALPPLLGVLRTSDYAFRQHAENLLSKEPAAAAARFDPVAGAPLLAQAIEAIGRLAAVEPNALSPPAEPLLEIKALAIDPAAQPLVRQAAQRVVGRLRFDVSDRAAVAGELARRAAELYRTDADTAEVSESPVTVWQWDQRGGVLLKGSLTERAAELNVAATLARRAYELERNSRAYRRLYLETMLAQAEYHRELGQPLAPVVVALANEAGVEALLDLVAHAPDDGDASAAAAAAQLLGKTATAELLYRDGSRASALARALRHSDPRLRYAALDAVLSLAPSQHFVGDSFVAENLSRFVATTGQPVALVADSRGEVGRSIAAMLGELGYRATSTTDGRDLFRRAAEATDCELILLSATLYDNEAVDVLDQLRKDGRTARIPVAVYAPTSSMHRAERLARGDVRTSAILRPHDPTGLQFQLAPLLGRMRQSLPNLRERNLQAAGALAWLDRLTSGEPTIFDVTSCEPAVQAALDNPALTERAAAILARFGTPASQRRLAELASRTSAPLDVRQAAAAAFGASVEEFGTRLTSREILLEYDHYHNQGDRDPQGREVIGSILDTIEARAAAAR